MSNTFTTQDMEDYADYVIEARRMLIKPKLSLWYAEKNKPTKKIIDLSVLIESGIDVEGSNGMGIWFVDKLHTIRDPAPDSGKYECQVDAAYDKCQPRMNHKHAWPEGECPLPEGFEVKVWFRSGGHTVVTTRSGNYWGINGDTMCFEVLGVADGYVMPWESE